MAEVNPAKDIIKNQPIEPRASRKGEQNHLPQRNQLKNSERKYSDERKIGRNRRKGVLEHREGKNYELAG